MREIVLAAAVFVAILLFLRKAQRERDADRDAPVLSEHARVHVKESTMQRRYAPPNYYLYFYIPERDTVEQCLVSKKVYDEFEKGDWGTLTHQGSTFMFFAKDN